MKLSFDHLVHFLYRPPLEASDRLKKAGFHTVAGGRHESWGTYNSLSYFGLSYVEFLAVEFPDIAASAENPLVRQLVAEATVGEGMGQLAFRADEIERWAERFEQRGYQVTGPLPGSRKREDGTFIQWKMLFAEGAEKQRRIPFLIQWDESDEARVNDLTRRGMIAPHENGSQEIAYIALATGNLDEAARDWQEWLGLVAGEEFADERLQAKCRRIQCDGADLLLCQPMGAGVTRDALSTRGERPFLIRFAGPGSSVHSAGIFGGNYEWSSI
ncbi:VOC family protein [Brevibacillus sp. FSL L8-0520]|uniref:VOC family protein n=1 Tax=Brevibacillus TaxID=55080 RepID=UPI0030CB3AFF